MKTPFYLLLLVLPCILTIASCNKSTDNPTPFQIDSLNAALPKEIINSYSSDSSGIQVHGSYVASIKYDTVNRTIQIYLDDTTTTNLYDLLAKTYTYNSSGFLTSVKAADFGGSDQNSDNTYSVTINRGTDNTINYIAEVSKDGSVYDSIFYNYQAVSGGTKITTVNHYYQGISSSGNDTLIYSFTSNNHLTRWEDPGYETNTDYTLNTNGTIKSYVNTSPNETITANYMYASGLPDGKADAFTQALLGKDYYLPDLIDLDLFVYAYNTISGYDYFNIPFTDAYHISAANLQVTNLGNPITESANWMYQLNAQNNVTQVVYSNNFNDMETVKIKY
jgi:hypothetical protein